MKSDSKEFSSGERIYDPQSKLLNPLEQEQAQGHLDRYRFASQFLKERVKVLDAACGSGYGTEILSERAFEVSGVDLSEHGLNYANAHHKKFNNKFLLADLQNPFPFESGYFDMVVSFETLEHVVGQEDVIKEFYRVIRPGGLMVISTPDRDTFINKNIPENIFHVRELNKKEFLELLGKYFQVREIYGQGKLIAMPSWKRAARAFINILPRSLIVKIANIIFPTNVYNSLRRSIPTPITKLNIYGPNADYTVLIAICQKI